MLPHLLIVTDIAIAILVHHLEVGQAVMELRLHLTYRLQAAMEMF